MMNLNGPQAKIRADGAAERNLRINTVSLVSANLVTGALGLAFWIAAARLYPAREVGIAAAQINSAVMVSFLSILSIDAIYERFLPVAGSHARSLLRHGFLLVAVVAGIAGCGLAAFGPEEMFEPAWAKATYPMLVLVLAVFTLQDKATVGLGVARWSATKNAVHAMAKLIAIFTLANTDSGMSIVLAWGATAAVIGCYVLVAVDHRCRSNPKFLASPNLPPRRQLWSFFGSSFGLTACWAVGNLAVPLIVVSQVGAEASAYFAVPWAIIIALYVTLDLIVSPYVAEVAANPHRVASLSLRMIRTLVGVTCIGSLSLALVAPTVLSVVGAEYRVHGLGLLYLAAGFVPLAAVGAIYEGFARVQRRLRLLLTVRCICTVLIVLGSVIATRSVGIAGVGWAYLSAEAVSAVVLLGPVIVWLRRAKQREEEVLHE